MELLDDRAETRGECRRQPLGEVELLARPFGRERRRPTRRRAGRRPTWPAGPATPSACRGTAPRCRPSRAARSARRIRRAISAQPLRNGPIRPGGPDTVPSGIWAKTPPLATTARADATCSSMPTPPRQTGSRPPTRRMSHSRQREVNVDGPLPRNQARGCVRDRVEDDERVHPAAMRRPDDAGSRRAAGAPGRTSRSGSGSRPKRMTRARSRRARYRSDARDSGVRPSQTRPSDRAAARVGEGLGRDPSRRWAAPSLGRVWARTRHSGRWGVGRVRAGSGAGLGLGIGVRGGIARGPVRRRLRVVASDSSWAAGTVAVPDDREADEDEPEGHDLGGRDAEERPVAAPEELEQEAGQSRTR